MSKLKLRPPKENSRPTCKTGMWGTRPRKREGRGQSGGGKKVGDSTLLDAAKQDRVSRDRSCREQLAGAPGPPACVSRRPVRNLDWALSSRCKPGFGQRIMAAVGPYRWLAERSAETIPVRDAELRSSTPGSITRKKIAARESCALTTPSFLSRRTRLGSMPTRAYCSAGAEAPASCHHPLQKAKGCGTRESHTFNLWARGPGFFGKCCPNQRGGSSGNQKMPSLNLRVLRFQLLFYRDEEPLE
jgi:hypothetical protein